MNDNVDELEIKAEPAGEQSEQVSPDQLYDYDNQIPRGIMQIFSMHTFLPDALNKATRTKDESMLSMLGPFCFLLTQLFKSRLYSPNPTTSSTHPLTPQIVLYRSTFLSRK